jgi:terminase small subunit-like protein
MAVAERRCCKVSASVGRIQSMAFDLATQETVCDSIAQGKTLTAIAKRLKLKSPANITDVVRDDPSFAANYARARLVRAEFRADVIDALADAAAEGKLDPQAARVAIDTKKWLASKDNPKVYGDKIQADIDATIRIELVNPFVKRIENV